MVWVWVTWWLKLLLWWVNGYGVFLEPSSFRHQVIRSKCDLNQNEWDANLALTAAHGSPWKFISHCDDSFIPFVSLKLCDGSGISFWEGIGVGGFSFMEAWLESFFFT